MSNLEAKIADLEAILAASRERLSCGHLKSNWLPSTADVDEGIVNPSGYCNACVELAALQSRIDAGMRLAAKWKAPEWSYAHLKSDQPVEDDCADELLAALDPKGAKEGGR
jgi:hypothetical protein